MDKTKYRREGGSVSIPADVARRARSNYDVVGDCHVSRYSLGSHGYPQVGWKRAGSRGTVTVARAVWTDEHGPIPDGMTVDHNYELCQDRRCIRLAHLRLLSNVENATDGAYRRPSPREGTLRGAYLTRSGRWFAQVSRGGVTHYLGTFDTPDEAAAAADAFRTTCLPW